MIRLATGLLLALWFGLLLVAMYGLLFDSWN
jgi:hypothetical protein